MKIVNRILTVLVSVAGLLACSGNTDIEDKELLISADRSSFQADGIDKVTFTVTYGTSDVSTSKDMVITAENGTAIQLGPGVNSFSTDIVGEWTFHATYQDGNNTISSKEKIKVEAEALESLSSGYYHRMLAMDFTSIHCTYCPILAEAIEKVQKEYPERIIPAAFHVNSMGEDPMALNLNTKIYEKVAIGEGLPLFAFDLRKSSRHIVSEYTKIVSEMQHQLQTYKCTCGVAIDSRYDSATRKLEVTAAFKCDITGSYRYHIFLVEDGIEYMQAGHEGNSPYIHMNTVRVIASDNIYGTKLNQGNTMIPGTEYTAKKEFEISSQWNPSKMRIIACILDSTDGSTYSCNNSNECALGGKADYRYEDKQ